MNAPVLAANLDSLRVLSDFLVTVSPEAYSARCEAANNASIGDHVRHCIDHYETLKNGSESMDFDKRKREQILAVNPHAAKERIAAITMMIEALTKEQLAARVQLIFRNAEGNCETLGSTYARELAFAHNHTIHHLAIIRFIGTLSGLAFSETFGIAPSTQRYRAKGN